MPSGTPPKPRRNQHPITPPAGRKAHSIPTTLTFDPEAKHLLFELAASKSLGAYVCGLVRAEWARQEERQRLRRLLEEENALS